MKKYFIYTLLILSICNTNAYSQHWIGRTIGDLPYLEYSNGQVRLGADKMGFIDNNIRLQVVDSIDNRYKVKLSQNWEAYIPKSFVKRTDEVLAKGVSNILLSGSWHLSGKENYDILSISLPERVPYKSFQVEASNKIIVDVFGVSSNTTWVTQLQSAKIVKNVYREQMENDVYRVHIELEGKQNWGYSINYNKNSLRISIKHAPAKKGVKDLFIAIDAGHGGSAKGAVSPNGIEEKEYNLKFAKELERLLSKKGVKNVYLTRTTDQDIATTDRVLKLREIKPDVLISLHLNSSSNKTVKGVSTYYNHGGSRILSQHILKQMLKLDLNEFGLIGNFNFLLNSPTEYPNSLVEIAFLSNAEDEAKIIDPKFHKQTAEQIYKGLVSWLKEVQQ